MLIMCTSTVLLCYTTIHDSCVTHTFLVMEATYSLVVDIAIADNNISH